MKEREIGRVTHYFSHLGVASLELDEELKVGDRIHVQGHTTDFYENVDSMEVEHTRVPLARPGDSIAIEVAEKTRTHDHVMLVD